MEIYKLTQFKSSIGIKPTHKKTLIALGLRKIGSSRVHSMTPSIKGMFDQVRYLVKAEKVEEQKNG
jgi:large subunit ribosomal protein L30